MLNDISNDSLVLSQGMDQDNLLLSEQGECSATVSRYQKQKKNQFYPYVQNSFEISQYLQNNGSLACYIDRDKMKDGTLKTYKKLTKQKQQFLSLDSRIQTISLKNLTKIQKINQLSILIQSQKIVQTSKKIKQYMIYLIQIVDDIINQKKSIQKDLQNIIEINKLMYLKLTSILKYFLQGKFNKMPENSHNQYFSFSKNKFNQTSQQFFDNFHFAKTIMSSIQQLQLRRVEEEEGISIEEMPLIELVWVLKNKSQGAAVSISQGLIDRVACGPTLKSWIKKIDEAFITCPKISEFVFDTGHDNHQTLLQQKQQYFIKNIFESKDPHREMQLLRYSSLNTFIQVLNDEKVNHSKQQIIALFGDINRILKLIQKKSGIQSTNKLQIYNSKDIIQLIQSLF